MFFLLIVLIILFDVLLIDTRQREFIMYQEKVTYYFHAPFLLIQYNTIHDTSIFSSWLAISIQQKCSMNSISDQVSCCSERD